jgi:hypothetical protein
LQQFENCYLEVIEKITGGNTASYPIAVPQVFGLFNPALAAATGDKFVTPQIRLRGICETLWARLKTHLFKIAFTVNKFLARNLFKLLQ